MRIKLLLILMLIPCCSFAQVMITGKVLDLDTQKPVADASVFLNNAITGDKTAADGSFTLHNVRPGQYDLIVSVVGYQTYSKTIMAGANNIFIPEINLVAKTIMLQEVKIKPNPNSARDLALFKKQFLGTRDNAKECSISNPDIIYLSYNDSTKLLSASSDDFLEIENLALGYKLKYKLVQFAYSVATQSLYYEGLSLFEELKGNKKQQRRWKTNRQHAYLGSSMHFLRSILANHLTADGFAAYSLYTAPNPTYNGHNDKYIYSPNNSPLAITDFAKRTDRPGLSAINNKQKLIISYNKKRDTYNGHVYQPLFINDKAISIITINEPYAFFDNNGIIINPHGVVFEGTWGSNRIAELLPNDYEPDPVK